jgi:hypothetical protein
MKVPADKQVFIIKCGVAAILPPVSVDRGDAAVFAGPNVPI